MRREGVSLQRRVVIALGSRWSDAGWTKLRRLEARWHLCRWSTIVQLRSWPGIRCERKETHTKRSGRPRICGSHVTHRQRIARRDAERWVAGVQTGCAAAPVVTVGCLRRSQGNRNDRASVSQALEIVRQQNLVSKSFKMQRFIARK